MNHRPKPHQAPAPTPPSSTSAEFRKLAEGLTEVMAALLDIIERESELVRAGKLREAMQLEAEKSALSRRYMISAEKFKAAQKLMSQAAPDLLASLRRHQDTFRAMLQVNLTVLATAHAVSEGIVRGVNDEMQRRNVPNTYTAAGRRAAPGPRHITPLVVSRSL
jgi:hypothetical protein